MVAVLGTWRVSALAGEEEGCEAGGEAGGGVGRGAGGVRCLEVAVVAEHACGNEEHEPAGCRGIGVRDFVSGSDDGGRGGGAG